MNEYEVIARHMIEYKVRMKAESPEEATYKVDCMICEGDGIDEKFLINDEWITENGVPADENPTTQT